jgi:hypothetical protein
MYGRDDTIEFLRTIAAEDARLLAGQAVVTATNVDQVARGSDSSIRPPPAHRDQANWPQKELQAWYRSR